ncbi:MAG: GSCFA domain-containing protein [Sphingobacteriales bacterium]|nr:MAG: GSCFA domain-containing protein [Sphingobacteriales bacterium]
MQLTLQIDIPRLPVPISYADRILLIGSCFTEHMAERLSQHKFRILSNPHGILFNPLSVTQSLDNYIEGKRYGETDLFHLNELWNSWDHHTRFSDINKEQALAGINSSQKEASEFIRSADWIIITLGSAFQYYLRDGGKPVANNHRAPGQWFNKELLGIETITKALLEAIDRLHALNPNARVLFTISPVRHIRDGVVENNRSKARLIESVHEICAARNNAFYFPAYELLIDILRDYRFYDIDFVHPNFLATRYVWERFTESCVSADTIDIMESVKEITTAASHRPRFPQTDAHRKFMESYSDKVKALSSKYPFLDLDKELAYFTA